MQVGDLKTQIRALQADSEEVKLNQEELNANMVSLSDQVRPVYYLVSLSCLDLQDWSKGWTRGRQGGRGITQPMARLFHYPCMYCLGRQLVK